MARYALVVGIDNNQFPLKSLSRTKGDAEAIAALLKRHGNFVEVKPLIGTVTQQQLELTFENLLHKQAERNEVMIYYTGHGFPLVESFGKQRVYLAPSDCKIQIRDGQVVEQQRGIPLESLNDLIRAANLSNLVMLLECCHSGSVLENRLVRETMTAFTETDYFLIAACRDFEQAYALKNASHSIFTTALLQGLTEEKNDRGQVTTGKLFDFISGQLQGSGQEPFYLGGGRSLTLVNYQPVAPEIVTIDEANPYQGLLAFTPETTKFFFGRDRVVQDLVRELSQSSFVPLMGASGSGKSSVVQAGLIPRLEEMGWRVLKPMKPGAEPIYELKRSFNEVFDRKKHNEIYRLIDEAGLPRIVDRLPNQKHLLVIDQFEEVFTLSSARAKQRQFIEKLMGLKVGGRLAIVATMRSDFLEAWQAHRDLVEVAQANVVLMPPLEGEELREAIVRPAQIQGYAFEAELEALILEDVAEEENCLPLLEFALTELWARRNTQKHKLTVAAYRQMGRLIGALNRYAMEWYEQLSERQQELVRRVMLELVRVGRETKDTRQRRKQTELLVLGDGEIAEVVELLVEQRLLVLENEEIDLVHERLMDGWELFAQWRQEDRDLWRLKQRVEDAEKEWQDKGKNDDYLIQGGLLSEVREQFKALSLSPKAQAFYRLSEESHQEKIVSLETALAESQLREQAMRIANLLSVQPMHAAIEVIQTIGNSISKLQNRVPLPLQNNVRQVSERVREFYYFREDGVSTVTFSPDGKIIAGGGRGGTIWLWKLDGECLQCFKGHSTWIRSVAFSPDGQTIASGSSDGTIRLWSLEGNLLADPFYGHSADIVSVVFSPDGQTIASGSSDGTIRLWSLEGNLLADPFRGHSALVWAVVFSPDGQTIASGSSDGTIRLWSLEGNLLADPFYGHSADIVSVVFSPDGQTIASGSSDSTIRLWDLEGNLLADPFHGHDEGVESVAFSSNGKMIISGSQDRTIRLWDLEGNPINQPFYGESDGIASVAFSFDASIIAIISYENNIRLWELSSTPLGKPFCGHSDITNSVAFSPDGQTIASGSHDKTIRLWDLEGNLLAGPFYGHRDHVWAVAFSPDGQTIASGSHDRTIRLWDLDGNPLGKPFQGHDDNVTSVAFSPDGKTIVSSSLDGTIRLWDLKGNLLGQLPEGHDGGSLSVAFSPDGATIISGGEDGNICLWNLNNYSLEQVFRAHESVVQAVTFFPDGKTIISSSEDETIRLWDLDGNPLGQPFRGHLSFVNSVAVSSNGQFIVSSSYDKTIRLWDLDGNLLGQPFQGHRDNVKSVAISPNGRTIVSGSWDNTVRLWLGGTWEDWLHICCNRFRDHPSLNDPNNPAAVEACEVCRKYVWEKEA
jgi:WD40 repeat protein/energy-coupling factor transporter ATP-binding protein EcfA2